MVSLPARLGIFDLRLARQGWPDDLSSNCPDLDSKAEGCALLELLLSTPCVVRRLSVGFGYLAQPAWFLDPMIQKSLLVIARDADTKSAPW